MKGQWIGSVEMGNATAVAQIDIDERRNGHEGAVTLTYGPNFPVFVVFFRSPAQSGTIEINRVPVTAFRYNTADPIDIESLRETYKDNWTFSSEVDIRFELLPNGDLIITWSSDDSAHPGSRTATLAGSKAASASKLAPLDEVNTWVEFKRYIDEQPPDRFFYRGQSRSHWRLRTAFHRGGRYSLYRFLGGEMDLAQRALAPHLRRTFDLADPVQNASFIHLIQHHGYPTPLLDWSYSPFVAAYFAFQSRRDRPDDNEAVRIQMFDAPTWQRLHAGPSNVIYVSPTLAVIAANAIDNPRSRPQQSISTATNVDDLEAYIETKEQESGLNFLTTIDLPYSERTKALRDLKTMNITAESLFPGLEGTCEALSIEHFDLDSV